METKEENLKKIQNRLRQNLSQKGFTQVDEDYDLLGPAERKMDFFRLPNPPTESDLPVTTRIKSLSGLDVNKELEKLRSKKLSDHVAEIPDEHPYRYVFHFEEFQTEDDRGYDVQIKATPVLLRKLRDYEDYSEYSADDAVEQTKSEVEDIMRSFEAKPYRGPYTDAEILDPLLADSEQDILKKHRYGEAVLDYVNQGDRCLQDDMLHAALSCYIHAIEWTIIHYKKFIEDVDLIDEQKKKGKYFDYQHLIDKIEHETPVTRMTFESLNDLNDAERKWIAHHRDGEIPRTNVENVRENLGKLVRELSKEDIQD
jgi:hypothetical protein